MSTQLTTPADLFDLSRPPHEHQQRAIELAAQHRVVVVTGGPGVGKTFTVNAIRRMFEANGLNLALCAPTGKAAVRMTEQTGAKASTIHRLLGWKPDGSWTFNASEPSSFDQDGQPIGGALPFDAVVIDEVSMVDVALFAGLVEALTPRQRLVIVGDVDQLPSIGAGRVLFDLIESGVIPTVRLTKIFRQAEESRIPYVARDINQGILPDLAQLNAKDGDSDVAWLPVDDAEAVQATIVEAVASLIPARQGIPSEDIQVLCPQHRGPVGDEILNCLLQERLNDNYEADDRRGLRAGRGYRLFADDRVMYANKNNYDLDVANGEVGRVLEQNWRGVTPPTFARTSGKGKPAIVVDFGNGRVVGFNKSEAQNLELAYAITVHKSQGSQFPCVVTPVHTANKFMLTRPLIYTAITRAERLLLMIGEVEALESAVVNTRGVERRTTLQPCLQDCAQAKEAVS